MQLRQPEALGMLDHHHGGVRDVEAYLDHRRGDEDIDLAASEPGHDPILLRPFHAPVQERDPAVERVGQRGAAFGGRREIDML